MSAATHPDGTDSGRDDVRSHESDDIRLLGRVVGDVLREQSGQRTFDLVEGVRRIAVSARRQGDNPIPPLTEALADADIARQLDVIRAFGWLSLAPGRGGRIPAALAGLATLAPMWVAMERLYHHSGHGPMLIVFVFVLIWAADIGAYFVGRRFGRYKLAPRVSPNKTWEGVLGGLALGALVALAGQAWFGFDAAAFLPLCMAVILVSVVGDLTESLFKRQVGVKDSSGLLPGHGGVLDRIDSLTSAVPVWALGLVWLGVLW